MDNLNQSDEVLISCFGSVNGSKETIPVSQSCVVNRHNLAQVDWEPPDRLWVKLNTDASFISATGEAWRGALLRSCTGQVLASAWGASAVCSSAFEAETTACLMGLRTLCTSQGGNVVVESDNKLLTSAIHRAATDRSDLCFSLRSIAGSLACFNNSRVCWVPRSSNEAAHCLAKFARESLSSGVLVGSSPCPLKAATVNDCNTLDPS